ncbi:hypothetical protein GCM10018773_35630 [Streptomyces candidus]|nr:hypothetical protein GCM10018773_35630 [Streptomyces candidus]
MLRGSFRADPGFVLGGEALSAMVSLMLLPAPTAPEGEPRKTMGIFDREAHRGHRKDVGDLGSEAVEVPGGLRTTGRSHARGPRRGGQYCVVSSTPGHFLA